ncbi:MAG: rhodanese-like domain-containing protein [Acidiphilium sp.]|nr:rhodanese-like domain-containing protein [Acidiphilium sp.]MDD4936719.1 rhodanese-like domain-containing protein [Acidiphilium sp.]
MTAHAHRLRDITPDELHEMLKEHQVTLIDVREPDEFAAARIHGALLAPLSSFDPLTLPQDPTQPIVLQCGSGKRSAVAAAHCANADVAVAGHLAGGIAAWMRAGLRTIMLDPATGKVVDRQ